MTRTYVLFITLFFQTTFAYAQGRMRDFPRNGEAREFGIERLEHRGTGCPQGSIVSQVSPDAQAFTMIFSGFSVDNSPIDGRPLRRACVIDVRMTTPRGWSFALFGVQVRGYAAIENGAIGVVRTMSTFGRRDNSPEIGRMRIPGPFDDNFEQFSSVSLSEAEFSPCGQDRIRSFRVKTAIVVRPQKGYSDADGDRDTGDGSVHPRGTISVDAVDGGIAQKFYVAWKKCPS